MNWIDILKERAGPQSRNAALSFVVLVGVLISVALPDFLEFRTFYYAAGVLEVERDELKGKRDQLVQSVIVRGNSSDTNGLYWRRTISSKDGGEAELNRGRDYDTWRKGRRPEQLIVEFASHASVSEIEAYDRAVERIDRLSREIGVYRTRAELGLPTFRVAVAKWSVPLVWLFALGVALWPVWEFRETLRLVQARAKTEDCQELPILSFVSVGLFDGKIRVAPSLVFRGLCLVMVMSSALACWMGYGYATAGYGPTGMPELLQSIYKYAVIGIATFVIFFLLRIAIWGPEPGGKDKGTGLMWSSLPRRSFISGGFAAAIGGLIISHRHWEVSDILAPYLRVRPKRRRIQTLTNLSPGFYWLSKPWPPGLDFSKPTNYGFDRLVYLEDVSDVRAFKGTASVLHGYDWKPAKTNLQPLLDPPNPVELQSLTGASGGTIRSYWIEHAALDLVENGKRVASAKLLKAAIDLDLQRKTASSRRISIRLVDLYCNLAEPQRRTAQLVEWIGKARSLNEIDLKRLQERGARWKNRLASAGSGDRYWKLPRRSIEQGPQRVARSVLIG